MACVLVYPKPTSPSHNTTAFDTFMRLKFCMNPPHFLPLSRRSLWFSNVKMVNKQ